MGNLGTTVVDIDGLVEMGDALAALPDEAKIDELCQYANWHDHERRDQGPELWAAVADNGAKMHCYGVLAGRKAPEDPWKVFLIWCESPFECPVHSDGSITEDLLASRGLELHTLYAAQLFAAGMLRHYIQTRPNGPLVLG